MKFEIPRLTLDYLICKFPQLTEDIIYYFFSCGKVKCDHYKYNEYKYIFNRHYVLEIPNTVAEYYDVYNKLNLIPDKDGVIYKVYIN